MESRVSASAQGYERRPRVDVKLTTAGVSRYHCYFSSFIFYIPVLVSFAPFINRHRLLRSFLDVVNAAPIALIAAVAIQLTGGFISQRQSVIILILSLALVLSTKVNTALRLLPLH
jgi:hypothetical protein